MKKTLSMLLAVLFALTAFGATALFGGVLGASAVFYDYYEYISVPGFTAFTEAEMANAWTTAGNFSGFSSDYLPEGSDVEKVATFTSTTPDKWGGGVMATMELKNSELSSWGSALDSCIWGANMTLGGKDIFGNTLDDDGVLVWENSFEDCAGFCIWVGINGGHYDGSVKIQLFTIPCKGPAYDKSNNGTTDMAQYGTGFVYECDGNKADEDGYVYFDFKTDFFQCDWWSTDDEGVNHFRTDDPHKYPIPQSKIPYINGIQFRFSNLQAGDVIYIGDMKAYKDTRIHTEDLEEQCAVFDALDPEAYTEESYTYATNIYLEAFEMLQSPEDYTQKQIDAKAKELKYAIRDLKPMYKAEMKTVKLAGFEVWDDDDFDNFACLDTPAIETEVYPNNKDQSVMVFANSQDGEPTYGWSWFTNGIDEDEDGIADSAIKNPFELVDDSEPLSEASGIRFWIKWDETLVPAPTSCRIGLGSSEDGVYFECEDTAVELPETQGYVGVAWVNFYDLEGDEDIYDYIDSIDYISIFLEGAVGIYYIADLTGFVWSASSADFDGLNQTIADAKAYMKTLNKDDYYYKTWDRCVDAIDVAEALIGKYGVDQDEVDDAAAEINAAINGLVLVNDAMKKETALMLEGLIKSAKTYWRGNVTSASHRALREEIEVAEDMIRLAATEDDAQAEIVKMREAIASLVPIKESSRVTSIYSFEDYTTRDFNRATGDRTANVLYELNKTFEKLPEGYGQALKMTAQVDMGSETTDQHGMMQFKAMYREGGTSTGHPTPIKMGTNENPKANTLIGDLTGTDGLCLWVGVNDMNLVQNCTMRVAVSNCEVGPLFERATVDIPVPSTGHGWLYLPWEYFEYYDDWTHGQEIDLAKIYFYIIRFDGEIKAGLEVYVTGIYAYKDVSAGTWEAPVITGVTEGENYDISENALVPDWNVGAAMLDGEFLVYGNPVTKNGEHTLVVTNGDKSTTVNFTTSGAIEYEEPVANVENGKTYEVGQAITWTPEGATATLDGEEIENGYVIEATGEYVLVVTNGDKEIEVVFEVVDELPPPPPAHKRGDMDGDDQITVADALKALRIAAKLVQPTEDDIAIGDVDGDGEITVADALKILRVAAKLVDESQL
ncbi:MAG: dockerin type I repeat-containing protein [Clostridia bacterium]|nr:dockerin type I repeat-containing protein [Clostridia bacterium]